MSGSHGREADGTPITDAMTDEAENGYDAGDILRRRRADAPPAYGPVTGVGRRRGRWPVGSGRG